MKILYIWDKDLPAWRARMMDATEKLYPDAEYYCITKENAFRGYAVLEWEEIGWAVMRFKGLKEWPYRWNHPLVFSDWVRFWFLGHSWDTLYLDTDAQMLQRVEFGEKVRYSPGDTHLMYAPPNGESRHLLEVLRAIPTPAFHHTIVSQFGPAWSSPVPKDWFHHGRAPEAPLSK